MRWGFENGAAGVGVREWARANGLGVVGEFSPGGLSVCFAFFFFSACFSRLGGVRGLESRLWLTFLCAGANFVYAQHKKQ